MRNQLRYFVFVVSVLSMLMAASAKAEVNQDSVEAEMSEDSRKDSLEALPEIPQVGEFSQPATTVAEWVAQTTRSQVQVAEITGVQLNPTPEGLEILLETTSGAATLVQTTRTEQGLVAEISNAQLNLPGIDTFRQENPTPDIAAVTVTPLDDNRIQVLVTGTDGVPTGQVFVRGEQGLVVNVTPVTEPPTPQAENVEPIELVVTAEREQDDDYYVPDASTAIGIDTPIKDTPLSIEVVPQEVIEDRNVRELGDALETVAGVVEAGGRGASVFGPNFKIRGFNVSDSLFGNGIPTNTLAPLSTNDLERVEVLKGPASILFGQGEPGGIINLVTKKPLSEPFYEASFSAGNFNTYEGALDFSGPLNESRTVKYRLNLSYENYESFRDFVDGERFLVSPTLTWEIGQNTSINFYGQYVSDRETIDSGIPAQGDGIVDVPRDRFLDEDFGEFEQEQFRVGYRFNHRFDDTWSVRHALEYHEYEPVRFGVFFDDFNEVTGELIRVENGSDERFQRWFTNVDAIAEFNTGSVEHQVLFGVEYLSNVDRQAFDFGDPFPSINVFNPVYSNNPFEIEPTFFRDDNVDSIGVYLQDQVDLLPNLIILAGVRFDLVDQFRTVQNLGEEREEFEQTDSDFTPRFGIVYKPIEPVSVYASYTTSYNPSFAASLNDGEPFDPETGRQFEVGVKTDITDQLSFTFAAFDIRKQNVTTDDPENPLFSIQTGEQASRGIELGLQGEILPGWNITAAYAYLDAFVSEDTTDIEDNQLPGVPDNQFTLWTTYEIQRGNLEGLGFGLGFLHLSDRQGDLDNTFTLPGFFRTDAALFYERNNWRAQLNIENLFNIEYFPSTNFDSRLGVNPGAPFTILGTIAVEF